MMSTQLLYSLPNPTLSFASRRPRPTPITLIGQLQLLGDGVTTLEMWEDRDDQIAGFLAFGEDIKRSRPDFNIVLHDAKKSY